jgi:hypothetical protein
MVWAIKTDPLTTKVMIKDTSNARLQGETLQHVRRKSAMFPKVYSVTGVASLASGSVVITNSIRQKGQMIAFQSGQKKQHGL